MQNVPNSTAAPKLLRLLSPEDLSELLGVPVQTLYSWNYRRVGPPAIKVGRHLRYRDDAVVAWLEKQAVRR